MAEFVLNEFRGVFKRAEELYNEEKYKDAVPLFRDVVEHDKDNYIACYYLADCLYYAKGTSRDYKKAFENDGVSVIIAKSPCTLIKGFHKKPPVYVNYDKCTNCDTCINELACPAISKIDGKIVVNQSMCTGCSICMQICQYGGFEQTQE